MAFDYAAYQQYITDPQSPWHAVRCVTLDRAHGHCERCGQRRKLHVHHWTYENLFREDPNVELEALCNRCHKSADFIRVKAVRKNVPLNRFTGWEFGESLPYEIWAKRANNLSPTSTVRVQAIRVSVPPPLPVTAFENDPVFTQICQLKTPALRVLSEAGNLLRAAWRYPYTDGQIIAGVSVFVAIVLCVGIAGVFLFA